MQENHFSITVEALGKIESVDIWNALDAYFRNVTITITSNAAHLPNGADHEHSQACSHQWETNYYGNRQCKKCNFIMPPVHERS